MDFLIFSYLHASLVSVPFNSNLCCGRVEYVGRTSLVRVKSVRKNAEKNRAIMERTFSELGVSLHSMV